MMKLKSRLMHAGRRLNQERILLCRCTVMSLAANDSNLLDIISCNELYFKYHKMHTMYVVGLASSYKSAVNLATDILIEVYKNTGAFDVRTYYGNQALGCDN